MLAPTWLVLNSALAFSLDAYGGQAACNYSRRQNTALVANDNSIFNPMYATSPADVSAYTGLTQWYNKAFLSNTSVYDYINTATPVNTYTRNLEYRIEHWAVAMNANTYAVFLNGVKVPFTPNTAWPAPDLTYVAVNWPALASGPPMNNMLDFLDFQIYVGVDMTITAGNIFNNGACMVAPPPMISPPPKAVSPPPPLISPPPNAFSPPPLALSPPPPNAVSPPPLALSPPPPNGAGPSVYGYTSNGAVQVFTVAAAGTLSVVAQGGQGTNCSLKPSYLAHTTISLYKWPLTTTLVCSREQGGVIILEPQQERREV